MIQTAQEALTLTCLDFAPHGTIPQEFTCPEDGNRGAHNTIPRLVWEKVPTKTKSFVLIADDPDARGGTWVHWVVYNIPADKRSVDYIANRMKKFPDGTLQGTNSWKRIGYDGPCPPPGKPHRYMFKLYALDTVLVLEPGAPKGQVEKAMREHILAHAEIVGVFGR